MGQKCSDFETIPLNRLFHQEQHSIGLKRFVETYRLDIPKLLAMINEKPRIETRWPSYYGLYRGEWHYLCGVRLGIAAALVAMKAIVHRTLTAEILTMVNRESSPRRNSSTAQNGGLGTLGVDL